MELLSNLELGFATALTPWNVLWCFVGVLLGTLVGVLPGIGPTATIAMLLPITFNFEPVASLIMLAGIYYGAQYGGSTTAILINLPGESSSAVTAIDGYQMAQQGRAGPALAAAALGSFFAGTVATVHPRPVRAAARPRGAEVRAAGIFLADRPRSRRLDRARPRLDRQGAGDDRARAASRHGRAGHLHRHAALHLRHPRALFGRQLRLRRGRRVRRRRDPAQSGDREDAHGGDAGDRTIVADRDGLPADRRAGASRHRARIGARHPARRRARALLLRLLFAREAGLPPSREIRRRARSRAWRGRNRPTTPRRRPRSSRC